MRLSPTRLASDLLIGVIVSMALAQAGAAMEISGTDRTLHARITRVGAHRLDVDGGHVAGDVEGAALSVVEQAAPDQGQGPMAPPGTVVAAPAPPGTFVVLAAVALPAPPSRLDAARPRGRAPPSA